MRSIKTDHPLSTQLMELRGIFLRIAASIGFIIISCMVKGLGEHIPLGEMVFFRSFFALIPLLIFLRYTQQLPRGLISQHKKVHILRGIFGMFTVFSSFTAIILLPIAEATAITYLAPMIMIIIAALWLKEKVSRRRWAGVLLGLTGMAMMTVPNFSLHTDGKTLLGFFTATLAAVSGALARIQIRRLSTMGENPGITAFYYALFGSIVGLPTMLFASSIPTLLQCLMLVGTGIIGGIAQLLLSFSLKCAPASTLAPYEYISIIWAVLAGLMFFDEIPGVLFWLATPIILAGSIIARPSKKTS